jgi:hypothetical protein
MQVLATKKPTVLILVNGGALSIDSILAGPSANNCSDDQFELDTDFHNQDNQTYTHADSLSACCSLCATRSEPTPCKFFTFTANTTMPDGSNCYMKSTDANRVKSAGKVSGRCHKTGSAGPGPSAIVEAFYPNQAGAAAIGPSLFAEHGFNRWGKLPITIYPAAYSSQLTIEQAAMRSDAATGYPGRTFKYYVGEPLFPFGAGLSLTTFNISCVDHQTTSTVTLDCTVRNTGPRDGDEVLLVFHEPPTAPPGSPPNPIRRLIDFGRVTVASGAMVSATFDVSIPKDLLLVGEDGNPRQVPGTHTITVQNGPSFTVQQ